MATFQFNNEQFYIDGRLKEQIDNKILPDLNKRDKDAVFCVDGRERSGKSTFTMTLGAYFASQLGTPYSLNNICMNPEEVRHITTTIQNKSVVIFDEAHRGMGSASALSEVNKILKDLMMEMGQKNLVFFVVLPSFFDLQRYQALFRTRGLFHIYEIKGTRRWVYLNERSKARLWLKGRKNYNYNCMRWPKFRGRFYPKLPVVEEDYREKKRQSFKGMGRQTRDEKYKEQRDKMIMILRNELGCKQNDIARYCKAYGVKLTRTRISKIEKEYRGKSGSMG